MDQYVIVGSSIAGLSAAEAIRERDSAAAISIVSEEPYGLYSRPGLAYVLRGDIPEKQLFSRTPDDLRKLRATSIHARAEFLRPAQHQVVLANGQTLIYDRLLVATGSSAIAPTFPGAQLRGVLQLDNLDDTRALLKAAARNKTAVVIGGGITALELVEGLRARGLKVHYFMRGDRFWANVLDEAEARLIEDRLRDEGVIIHTRTQVKQAIGKRDKLTAVETQSGEQIKCDVLAVAIGVRPRLELAQTANLALERGILVDEYLRTSAPDVYAAGDVAQVHDPHSGRAILDVLWSTALDQGRAAGLNMAGPPQPYVKQVAMNVTQLAGLVTTVIGSVGGGGQDDDLLTISRGESEAWRMPTGAWVLTEQHAINRLRLLVSDCAIVGAVVIGDQTWSRALHHLIAAEADICSIRAQLEAEPDQALTQLSNFYQQWEQTHRASTNV
ncbi:MAG: NAD(P)/FAD-dependent oxidoreductase [Thermoflexales bacterium]|nr:NAD(P)/FAD-dependent oxidoreductase [Thermoflexales bacterium]